MFHDSGANLFVATEFSLFMPEDYGLFAAQAWK